MRHIGIYSGTFNPVHVGHLSFADKAYKIAALDKVVFLPEETPRGKANITPLAIRIRQLEESIDNLRHEIYCASHPRFTIAETLIELRTKYLDAKLSFLIGSDLVAGLKNWPDIDQFIQEYQMIIGMRSTDDRQDVETIMQDLGAQYIILNTPYAHVSSRQIRRGAIGVENTTDN